MRWANLDIRGIVSYLEILLAIVAMVDPTYFGVRYATYLAMSLASREIENSAITGRFDRLVLIRGLRA